MENDNLLRPGEVARRFGVNPKTITRWANSGTLVYVRLPSGHRRFRESDVKKLLDNR